MPVTIPGARVPGKEGQKVRPFAIPASFPRSKSTISVNSTLALFCLALFIAFATFSADAQTAISPTTNTIQFAGTPAQSSITAPTGAQVLYGTAVSQIGRASCRERV